jgi:regulatory protein
MDSFEKLLALALRFLSLRPHSEKEIKDYLQKKKYSQEVKDKVSGYLHEHRLIDDKDFAKWFVDQRTRVKPQGKRLIRLELMRKGIAAEIIAGALNDEEANTIDQVALAKKLVEKKLQKYKQLSREEIYQKLGAFLARRGFDWETIKKSIDSVMDE